ncbi:MAG: 2-amino-4-hydroxy-6-hydroxymethyldihydropteridine diphosphokinase [Candidatus Aminicenantes bacterium]|nr:2-amino-4-hydroxy-6-hydroxymethyldihydropteridine diphosphokinase [Candidatus Aminicenantes bacterium]
MNYYLSIGSNMGERKTNLDAAISFLKGIGEILRISSIYETAPLGMAPGTENFYNLVLVLKSTISPPGLLKKIKEFEKSMGRDISNSHKRPRVIDIDILLAGDVILNEKDLVIPHHEMHKRAFVLIPLAEIAPTLVHPLLRKPVKDLLQNLEPQKIEKIIT